MLTVKWNTSHCEALCLVWATGGPVREETTSLNRAAATVETGSSEQPPRSAVSEERLDVQGLQQQDSHNHHCSLLTTLSKDSLEGHSNLEARAPKGRAPSCSHYPSLCLRLNPSSRPALNLCLRNCFSNPAESSTWMNMCQHWMTTPFLPSFFLLTLWMALHVSFMGEKWARYLCRIHSTQCCAHSGFNLKKKNKVKVL